MSDIAERVREAHAGARGLRVRGAGTWLDAGRPTRGESLSLADDRGIVEYVPGDLTLTARAGTPLADIVAATRRENQWLPLDPWGGDSGTLGATISTASAGPRSYSMGLPRDIVLGMEFVSGSGEVVRAGGRVVKNVAGFDLTRLLIGSWGTLGVITEVTVRLRARPEQTRTLVIRVSASALELNGLATSLRALPFTPLASELVNARLASHLGIGSQLSLLVCIGGNENSVRGQLDALRPFGDSRELADDVWQKLRTSEPSTASAWRWSQLPALFGDTWTATAQRARDLDGALMHGNPARGVVRVVAPRASGDAAKLASAATAFDGTVAVESLPPEAWPLVSARPAHDSVSRAIRGKFDPRGILNAGILGDA